MSSFSTVIAEHYIDIPFNLKTSVSFRQMSSQSYNATDYSGYVDSGNVEPIPSRDASDVTRSLKERIMYNEKKAGSPINANKAGYIGNAQLLWQLQGNQFRMSYLFGKVKCGACVGGAFNLNGPLQAS